MTKEQALEMALEGLGADKVRGRYYIPYHMLARTMAFMEDCYDHQQAFDCATDILRFACQNRDIYFEFIGKKGSPNVYVQGRLAKKFNWKAFEAEFDRGQGIEVLHDMQKLVADYINEEAKNTFALRSSLDRIDRELKEKRRAERGPEEPPQSGVQAIVFTGEDFRSGNWLMKCRNLGR